MIFVMWLIYIASGVLIYLGIGFSIALLVDSSMKKEGKAVDEMDFIFAVCAWPLIVIAFAWGSLKGALLAVRTVLNERSGRS